MPEYNNVIGTSFPKFVKDQIEVRRGIISSETRSGEELSYLNNRTGWYRMTSAAVVEDSDELARNNILQGGVVSKNNDNTIALKKDFIERYTKGNDDDLGLRPMPGITGLSIGTKGKWQTLQVCLMLPCLSLFLVWSGSPQKRWLLYYLFLRNI